MTTFLIPIEGAGDDGAFFFRVDLGGVDYQLAFQYNSRERFWYFDLLDENGDALRTGIKCVANWPLLWRMVQLTRPDGELFTWDTRPIPVDPVLETLGVDAQLLFYEFEEVS